MLILLRLGDETWKLERSSQARTIQLGPFPLLDAPVLVDFLGRPAVYCNQSRSVTDFPSWNFLSDVVLAAAGYPSLVQYSV